MAAEKSRSEVFRDQRPALMDADLLEAARETRMVESFMAAPVCLSDGTIRAIGLKWKLGDGKVETVIIDRYSAMMLRMLFEHLDKNNWTGTALIPTNARPNDRLRNHDPSLIMSEEFTAFAAIGTSRPLG